MAEHSDRPPPAVHPQRLTLQGGSLADAATHPLLHCPTPGTDGACDCSLTGLLILDRDSGTIVQRVDVDPEDMESVRRVEHLEETFHGTQWTTRRAHSRSRRTTSRNNRGR